MTNIQKSAVLVRLNISQWGGEKIDKAVSDEVATNKNAKDGAGRYVKKLIVGSQLKEISTLVGKARNVNKAQTLKYLEGRDLLPVTNFDGHSEIIGNYKSVFDGLVDEFLSDYEKHRDAQQLRLGDMFNQYDYPTVDELRDKFNFTISYEPLADGNQFDKMFGSEELEKQLIEQAEADMQSKIDEAMRDLWGRLIKRVKDFNHKMNKFEPAVKGVSRQVEGFKGSLVENIREICDVLPRLNVTGDADLAKFASTVQAELSHYDVEDLKQDDVLRKQAADKSQAILDQMMDVYGG